MKAVSFLLLFRLIVFCGTTERYGKKLCEVWSPLCGSESSTTILLEGASNIVSILRSIHTFAALDSPHWS